jgi:hypothetical protein
MLCPRPRGDLDYVERVTGIEPALSAWEVTALSVNDLRDADLRRSGGVPVNARELP